VIVGKIVDFLPINSRETSTMTRIDDDGKDPTEITAAYRTKLTLYNNNGIQFFAALFNTRRLENFYREMV